MAHPPERGTAAGQVPKGVGGKRTAHRTARKATEKSELDTTADGRARAGRNSTAIQ